MIRDSRLWVAAAVAVVSVACGGGAQPAAPASAPTPAAAPAAKKPAPAEPAASAEPPSAAEHGGVPKDPNERPETPHGGTMVVVGEKAAQMEVVYDSASGRLGVYFYGADGHTPMKIKTTGVMVHVTPEGATAPLMVALAAQEDPATGDTKGDASHFQAEILKMKGVTRFSAVLPPVSPVGPLSREVRFAFPM